MKPRFYIISAIFVLTGIFVYKFLFSSRPSLDLLPEPEPAGIEKQVAEKIRNLRNEVVKNPASATAWGKLAMNLDVHDFKREAIPCYKQAAALEPTEFRWSYYCSILLHETGSPQALEWLDRSRKLKPDYAPLHVLHGQALFNAGRLEESDQAFHRALSADPKSSHACLGLAQIALSRDDLQNCQQYLLKALDIDPQHREARGLLAEVYRRCNEPEKAARELEIAQRLPRITPLVDSLYEEVIAEGVSALWYRERGLAYLGKGLTEKAIGEFQVALQLKPDPQGHNYVGELLHQIGKHEEAARHYRAAINLNPTYPEAFINLGTALAEMGQTQQGIVWIERALRLNPAIPEAYLSLGAIYTRSGRPTEAIAALRRGLSFAPNDVQMATQLAWILATCSQAILRNGAEALSLAKNVCEKTSCRDPQILDVLAAAYAETNQFNKAIETAQKAHQLAASADLLDLANQIQSRLKLYAAAKPYRDNKF